MDPVPAEQESPRGGRIFPPWIDDRFGPDFSLLGEEPLVGDSEMAEEIEQNGKQTGER